MADKQNPFDTTDWELSEEYYQENEDKRDLKLEDFMLPEDEIPSTASAEDDPALFGETGYFGEPGGAAASDMAEILLYHEITRRRRRRRGRR